MDGSDWRRAVDRPRGCVGVLRNDPIVHMRGAMTLHILVHKGSGSGPSYCSSRTTSENAEAWLLCEA